MQHRVFPGNIKTVASVFITSLRMGSRFSMQFIDNFFNASALAGYCHHAF